MAIESTLLIVKPDGVRRGLVGEVLRRVEAKGLAIDAMRLFTIDRALAEEHYGEHVDKPFFGELVDFITGGPVVVAKVSGEQAHRGSPGGGVLGFGLIAASRPLGCTAPRSGAEIALSQGIRTGVGRDPGRRPAGREGRCGPRTVTRFDGWCPTRARDNPPTC